MRTVKHCVSKTASYWRCLPLNAGLMVSVVYFLHTIKKMLFATILQTGGTDSQSRKKTPDTGQEQCHSRQEGATCQHLVVGAIVIVVAAAVSMQNSYFET